jgi:hypothetical protein
VNLLGAALSTLLLLVPLQAQSDQASVPDLAQVALGADDADGWTPAQASRDEVWAVSQAAPDAPGEIAWYETRFTRLDGQQELTTRATLARPDLADGYFAALRHNALGQTPISTQQSATALAWRERDTASAVARSGNLIVELHLHGLSDAAPVSDDQVAAWLSRLLERADAAPRGQPVDWSQLLPGQPLPWQFVLDDSLVGSDWQAETGLELSSREEPGGQVDSVSAAREFSRTGAFRRTLRSTVSVFGSADAASAVDMTEAGSAIDAPALGDAAAAFRLDEPGGREAPTFTYTVDVRRGSLIFSTEETGVAWSLDSPDELFVLASAVDAHAAQLLNQ